MRQMIQRVRQHGQRDRRERAMRPRDGFVGKYPEELLEPVAGLHERGMSRENLAGSRVDPAAFQRLEGDQ